MVLIVLTNAFLKQFVSILPLNATRSTFYAMCFVNRELFKHCVKSFLLCLFFPPLPFVLKQVVVLAVLLESIKCLCPTRASGFGESQTRISLRTLNPKQRLPGADKAWNAHNQSTDFHCREKNKRLPRKQPHVCRQSITVLPNTMAQLRNITLHAGNTQPKPKCQLETKCFLERVDPAFVRQQIRMEQNKKHHS